MRQATVPVIDIFAGPGGLGEGFSACSTDRVRFEVALSVEKDTAAFGTLLLRTFFRQFSGSEVPEEYYHYLRDEISCKHLFDSFPEQAQKAMSKCLLLEMGPNSARQVFSEIERALNDNKIWALIGGPPCQAYSVIGRSRRAKVEREEFEQDIRHTLYREYLRILGRFNPPIFVLENVAGLLSATFSGTSMFDRIIADLSSPVAALRESVANPSSRNRRTPAQYSIHSFVHGIDGAEPLRPSDYVIQAEKFGIPQKRHRVILLGIRSDLMKPKGLRLRPSAPPNVGEMISDLPKLRSRLSDKTDKDNSRIWANSISEGLANLSARDFDRDVWSQMRDAAAALASLTEIGGRSCPRNGSVKSFPKNLTEWIHDPRMDFACNHEARCHMPQDLIRYLYVSSYAKVRRFSPKLHHFPQALLPNHKSVQSAIKAVHGNFNDRFRAQIECAPATTVTSHISKDGHYFIHHDPAQCRSWTVREAARIQTFPDNYFFEGMRTEEYRQVGNAVPPYLAFQLAEVVARLLEAQL
jgi:DNA (cytosine-5)-methyltransferase 1